MAPNRRDFLKAAAAGGVLAGMGTRNASAFAAAENASRRKLLAFNYDGVRLLPSRWQQQFQESRDFYYNVPDDDILQGFRAEAGLPAPGKPLGGWCDKTSETVFGQWLSGMSRMYRATNDTAIRDKALYLMHEYAKTVGPDGNCKMSPYGFEKLICGLTDMHEYAGAPEATALLDRYMDWASKTFDHTRTPAGPVPWEMHSGKPLEWYTLPENLYRAYVLTGNTKFKDFADVWLYHAYWNKFTNTASPSNASGVHAYSHVNSFSSASMAYVVSGDPSYLQILKNAYDFLQSKQCYATGGYGPVERIMPAGSLGKALENQQNTFETPCGSWAGFKMSRYLTEFTGESRYADWAERLFYNGIGAALRIHDHGQSFYYADYRVGGGVKTYARDPYTCCAGTYIQDTADFHNLIYYRDENDANLYVTLYLPSELTWKRKEGTVTVTQETTYPLTETTKLTVKLDRSSKFGLNFRIPTWAQDASLKVNGSPAPVACAPGQWATIDRAWNSGDSVELHIPLRLRWQAVDAEHPRRVALVRGPVVMVQQGFIHEPIYKLPETEADLNKYLHPDPEDPYALKYLPPDGTNVMARFHPFYYAGLAYAYRMYFDLDKLPIVLWS